MCLNILFIHDWISFFQFQDSVIHIPVIETEKNLQIRDSMHDRGLALPNNILKLLPPFKLQIVKNAYLFKIFNI